VQAQEENELPEIVYHTFDKKRKKYFHKFLDRKQAQELLDKEKAIVPSVKFRVVKCTEIYDAGNWQ